MRIVKTRPELEAQLGPVRANGTRIGFVPTMGALHQGHLALVAASKAACGFTACSIFVNPTQFNDPADLEKYPRTPERDARLLQEAGCDLLFMPPADEIYAPGEQWHMDLEGLDQRLEGEFRPGHFQGVTQVVHKLFDLVKPDVAFFGQKDFQQFRVISRMVERMDHAVDLVMHPIVRETDGLAMSSRNTRLSAAGRIQALAIYKALEELRAGFGHTGIARLEASALDLLSRSEGVTPEYVRLCHPLTLEPSADGDRKAVALVAAWVDDVRLIDNVILEC